MRLAEFAGGRTDRSRMMFPVESGLGNEMQISCWHCSLCLMRFIVREGTHLLSCSRCHLVTQVTISRQGQAWGIKTGRAEEPSPPKKVG